MKKRPTSVTVIAWVLIATGGVSLITSTAMINDPTGLDLMRKSPIPIPVQYAQIYIGLLITLVSGIAMLKGRNWARSTVEAHSTVNSSTIPRAAPDSAIHAYRPGSRSTVKNSVYPAGIS